MTVTFTLSEAQSEFAHHEQPDTFTLWTPDFVQLTYETLRSGPDGDEVAVYNDGYWTLISTGWIFSDVTISP